MVFFWLGIVDLGDGFEALFWAFHWNKQRKETDSVGHHSNIPKEVGLKFMFLIFILFYKQLGTKNGKESVVFIIG